MSESIVYVKIVSNEVYIRVERESGQKFDSDNYFVGLPLYDTMRLTMVEADKVLHALKETIGGE